MKKNIFLFMLLLLPRPVLASEPVKSPQWDEGLFLRSWCIIEKKYGGGFRLEKRKDGRYVRIFYGDDYTVCEFIEKHDVENEYHPERIETGYIFKCYDRSREKPEYRSEDFYLAFKLIYDNEFSHRYELENGTCQTYANKSAAYADNPRLSKKYGNYYCSSTGAVWHQNCGKRAASYFPVRSQIIESEDPLVKK